MMDMQHVQKLAMILQENGDQILDGSSKLSLSISLLELLHESFKFVIDDKEVPPTTFQVIQAVHSSYEILRYLQFLHDFVQKTIGLKIDDGGLQGIFTGKADVSKFRSLSLLELRKVSVNAITGISKLQRQLKVVICVKCVSAIEELLEKCGCDNTIGGPWSQLREAVFSHNNLETIDSSFKYTPYLQVLDLSHNKIKDAQPIACLPKLKHVNLGYNHLESVPLFSEEQSKLIQTLILKNNYIENLEGLITLSDIRELDVSCNCLIEHSSLSSIPNLATLQWLCIDGNPLSHHPRHRKLTAKYLHANTASVKFILDHLPLSKNEKILVGTFHVNFARLPEYLRERKDILAGFNNPETRLIPTDSIVTPSTSTAHELESSLSLRKSNRVREAVITEHEKSEENENTKVDRGYTEILNTLTSAVEIATDHLKTKEKIEELHKVYGKEWLHTDGGSQVQDVLCIEKTPIPVQPTNLWYLSKPSALGENFDSVSPRSSKTMMSDFNSESTDMHYDTANESMQEDGSGGDVSESNKTVVLDSDSDLTDVQYEKANASMQVYGNEGDVLESKIVEVENSDRPDEDANGGCGQLFIVNKKQSNGELEQLFFCVNVAEGNMKERSIVSAKILAQWNLSALLSYRRDVGSVSLSFNTILKDKKMRTYLMNDDEAENLCKLLKEVLGVGSPSEVLQTVFHCLKCLKQFSMDTDIADLIYRQKLDDSLGVQCSACKSTIVIEISSDVQKSGVSKTTDASPELCEIVLPDSPSHSSIAVDASIVTAELLEVTADVPSPAAKPNASSSTALLPYCSAASLDDSNSSRVSVADSQTRRGDSDIEVLSNPSQDSIEVLAVLARGSSLTPKRRRSSDEYRLEVPPALSDVAPDPTTVSATPVNVTMGLTESSSSDSLTGSVRTAYENRPSPLSKSIATTIEPVMEIAVAVEDPEATAEPVVPIGMFSTMLEGLFHGASKIVNMSPVKIAKNPAPASGIDSAYKFSYSDFTQIDHRIKVHLYLNVFDDETEELVWLLRGEILPHNAEQPYSGCLVLSTRKIYILQIDGDAKQDEPSQWLRKADGYTADRLQMFFTLPWKQGIGMEIRQTTYMTGATTFYVLCLLQDVLRTSTFFAFLAGSSLPDSCELNTAISETTMLTVQQLMLSLTSDASGELTTRLLCIVMLCEVRMDDEVIPLQQHRLCTMIVTDSDFVVSNNSLSWMRPDANAQLKAVATQTMINLVEVVADEMTLDLHFFDETTDKKEVWTLWFATNRGVNSIIQTISAPWANIFSVPLQVNYKNKEL